MITESKSCYNCGITIPQIKSNIPDKQTDQFGIPYTIETITTQCRNGHKNPVTVNHEVNDNV